MQLATTTRHGKKFVLVPEREFHRMTHAARPVRSTGTAGGTANAIDFARSSIARTVARDRRAAGLSQQALAKLAGLRAETISRIESGRHTATVATLDRIEKALEKGRRRAV